MKSIVISLSTIYRKRKMRLTTSVMDPVSIPPSKSLSISTDPVVKWRIFLRVSRASAAVWNSIATIFLTISFNLMTLASEMPFTSERRRVVAWATFYIEDIRNNEEVSRNKEPEYIK